MRLLCPWDSPGKNIGVGCHFLLQGIFPTQGSNTCLPCLLLWSMDSLLLSHQLNKNNKKPAKKMGKELQTYSQKMIHKSPTLHVKRRSTPLIIREMQIKIKIRYQLIHQDDYYQKINKQPCRKQQLLGRMWRNRNSCASPTGILNGASTVENNMIVPQKVKNRITV